MLMSLLASSLLSRHRELKYWLTDGTESEWVSGVFRTGLFSPVTEFNGSWIGHEGIQMNELRKEFSVPPSLSRATVFISTAGYYELYLNGTQVDPSRRMDPGWTLWEKDVFYVTYDVTHMLTSSGSAAVGVRLGDGWYSQQQNQPGFGTLHTTYGPSRLLFQLNMQTTDGGVVSVVSDTTWMGREGTVTSSSPYMGEQYSALKERPGWDLPGFSDPLSLWIPAAVLPSPLTDPNSTTYGLRLQTMDPIRAGADALHVATNGSIQLHTIGADLFVSKGVLHPVGIEQPTVGIYVYDMGQTFSGTCTVTFSHVPARIAVSIHHAEVMRPTDMNGVNNGLLDESFNRGATSMDWYITKGVEGEQFTPKFTVHGFRSPPSFTPSLSPVEASPGSLL